MLAVKRHKLPERIIPNVKRTVRKADAHAGLFRYNVVFKHGTVAVRSAHVTPGPGHLLAHRLIAVLLVLKAAHEPAAYSGYLCRRKRQALLLCHFDGYRRKVRKERLAADRPSAGAKAAKHLGLIAHAYLPKLNPGPEYAGKILYKLAEVHPSVRSEVEYNL